MKRKTKQIVSIVFLIGVILSFYNIYSFFADDYNMTEEEYAREAMKIVKDNNQPLQPSIDVAK